MLVLSLYLRLFLSWTENTNCSFKADLNDLISTTVCCLHTQGMGDQLITGSYEVWDSSHFFDNDSDEYKLNEKIYNLNIKSLQLKCASHCQSSFSFEG